MRAIMPTLMIVVSLPPMPVQAFDFTCTDSGTRKRIAVFQENPPEPLPCTVGVLEHPLGTYHLRWQEPWRAVNDAEFCKAKAAEIIEEHRTDGWKCLDTTIWRGGESN